MCYCTLSPTSASRRACLASQRRLPGVRGSLGWRPSSPELTAGLRGGTRRGLGESGAATGTTDGAAFTHEAVGQGTGLASKLREDRRSNALPATRELHSGAPAGLPFIPPWGFPGG